VHRNNRAGQTNFSGPHRSGLLQDGHTHTHTRLTALFLGPPRVSRYQKCKTNLDFTEARDSEWQWHQLRHMQVCTWLQTDNHASTPPLSFFTGLMPFLPPNQQRQSTEGPEVYSFFRTLWDSHGNIVANVPCWRHS